MFNRALVLSICVAMLASISSAAEYYRLSQLSEGSIVYDPSWTWNESALDWTVVAQDHFMADSTVLWTASSIGTGQYHESWGNSWELTAERAYLNGTFYEAFSDSFKGSVLVTTTNNYNLDSQIAYNSEDNVFAPSATELGITVGTHWGVASPVLGAAIAYFSSDAARDIDVSYWTRTPAAAEWEGTVYRTLNEYLIGDAGSAYTGPWVTDNYNYAPMVNLDSDTLVMLEGDGRYSIVPEPATLALLVAGCVGFIARKKKC